MPTHKEFTAWITVDDRKVPEYKVNAEEDGRKVACFIPSVPGQRFSVHWRDDGSNTFTAAYIQCDGFITPGRYLSGKGEQVRSGIRSGPESERPFMFAEIPKTTSRNISNAPDPKHVGTIILKIMQAQRGPPRHTDSLRIAPGGLSSEWISTTGGHCATFSREEVKAPLQYPITWSTKPMDPDDLHSYVKFIFHYRSMEWLIDNKIADPKTASIHLGSKIQFTVTPQQYPVLNTQGPFAGGVISAFPDPIDMKVAQMNTLNPEKKDKGKERAASGSKPKREKKPPKPEEPELDDEPFVDPRLTVDVEELKRKYLPHLVDPSKTPPPYWYAESDNQKRKRERARRQAEKEAREAERLEKERKEEMERRKASSSASPSKQTQSQRSSPMHSQHSSPSKQVHPHPQAPEMVQYFIPYGAYPVSQAQLHAQNLGYGRPPLASRSASSSRLMSAGGSSTRIVSDSSVASFASSSSTGGYDYGSEPGSADPSPSLKRTRTMPVVPSQGAGPSSRMDYGMRRDFSTASYASMYSIPGSSQESWDDWNPDDGTMDTSH